MAGPLPTEALALTKQWASFLGPEWARSRTDLVPATDLRWQADFDAWIGSANSNRIDRVMRRLRRTAPREYDVLHRTLLLGEGFEEVTEWLNARALHNDIPLPAGRDRHYELKDAVTLFEAGVTFVRTYW